MGDRIAIMNEGRLQQVGPPQEVYDRPANLFVARFIGSPPMNTVAGDVVGDTIVVAGTAIPLPGAIGAAVRAAGCDAVVLGVRPEHLEISDAVAGSGGVLPATVTVVESLGHERHVICRLDDGQMVIVRIASDEAVPGAGSTVRLSADPGQLHVFDAATEGRIDAARIDA